MRARPRVLAQMVGPAVLAAVLAGCSGQVDAGQGFVSGGGQVTILDESERTPAPDFEGTSLAGEQIGSADFTGDVVIVNVWGSWCAPCREEAPDLVAAAERMAPAGVQLLGINTRDYDPATAEAFVRRFGVSYPSIFDPDGVVLLNFADTLPPAAIPSTLIIDRDGQIAARVLGTVSESTLVGMVEEVTGETMPR